MSNIKLSYVLTTFNKLAYLKIVLEKTIGSRRQDEEIIVVDGGSKDGTAEYLRQLFNEGKIQKFVSEKDFGEGHGFNKGMLMAEGTLIKLLTDDDAYDYRAIAACKEYMLGNPDIDYLNTFGGWYDIRSHNEVFVFTEIYLDMMQEWKVTGTPFAFCMLGSMINSRSLPFLGLINPSIKRADAEYSLRITSQKIKMAWYLGVAYVRILNLQSNSLVFNEAIQRETEKLNSFYNVSIDGNSEEPRQTIGGALRKVYAGLTGKISSKEPVSMKEESVPKVDEKQAFEYAHNWMDLQNNDLSTSFISNK